MSLNYLLLWIVGISVGAVLVRAMRSSAAIAGGWKFVAIVVLAITGLSYLFIPDMAGLIGGAFWALFMLLPGLLFRLLNSYVTQQNFSSAKRCAALIYYLHPFDGTRSLVLLYKGLELFIKGQEAEAKALFNELSSSPTIYGQIAVAYYLAVCGKWEDLKTWAERSFPVELLIRQGTLMPLYLRSLGEVGELKALLDNFQKLESLEDSGGINLDFCRMLVFAFCGKPDYVALHFNGPLSQYPDDVKRFWIGTANLAADEQVEAHSIFLEQKESSLSSVSLGAEQRLAKRIVAFSTIADRAMQDSLSAIIESFNSTWANTPEYTADNTKPYLTYSLIGLNILVFIGEIFMGGSTNSYVLFRMGAVLPVAVYEGEQWWRVITAAFLHAGPAHLFANMLGLFILGPFVEAALRKLSYLFCYLLSAIGSFTFVILLTYYGYIEQSLLVGASGAVLGLIGATAAILLYSWYQNRNLALAQRLKSIVIILVIQAVFDISTPQISFAAHFGGVLSGFVVAGGLLMLRRLSFRAEAKFL